MQSWVVASASRIARTPSLWSITIRETRRFIPRGWWHRKPFLPVPSKEFVRFRLTTFAGDEAFAQSPSMARVPTPDEVVRYLQWCERIEKMRRTSTNAALS